MGMSSAQSYVVCSPPAHVARTDASGATVATGVGVNFHSGSWYISPAPRATVDRMLGPMLVRVSDGVLPMVLLPIKSVRHYVEGFQQPRVV
eukprot:scaffold2402_cov74-Phaeocystis_antarctica.AAC.3